MNYDNNSDNNFKKENNLNNKNPKKKFKKDSFKKSDDKNNKFVKDFPSEKKFAFDPYKNKKFKRRKDFFLGDIIKIIPNKKNFFKKKSYIKNYNGDFAYWEEDVAKLSSSLKDKNVQDAFLSFVDLQTGEPIDFDKVYDRIKNSEEITKNQELVYIGNNKFAIIEELDKKVDIIKTIEYGSDTSSNLEWQEKLKFQLKREKPSPLSLSELYSDEEIKSFPKLGSDLLSKFSKQEF